MSTQTYGLMYCSRCKTNTITRGPIIVTKGERTLKSVKVSTFYIKGICGICGANKSQPMKKQQEQLLPTEIKNIDINTSASAEQVSSLLPLLLPTSGSGVNTDAVGIASLTQEGDGIMDTVENVAGPLVRKGINWGVRQIPLVGDLIADTGIVDGAINWARDNIWSPIKSFFGGELFSEDLLSGLTRDEYLMAKLAENMFESKIQSGQGVVPKYIKTLRDGSEEDKTLAHLLTKTICKPKFYRYLKEKNISNDTNILEALKQYKNKDKEYSSSVEKAIATLKGNGYDIL